MKRFILFCFGFLVLNPIFGQTIHFPDPNFKYALVNTICVDTDGDHLADADADRNNDGEINVPEIYWIRELHIEGNEISNLEGINHFISLRYLFCSNNNLDSLDVTGLKNLEILVCSWNKLKTLNVNNLHKLMGIYCNNNQLVSLNVNGLQKLSGLFCSNNQLIELFVKNSISEDGLLFSNNPNLKYICCNDALIPSIESRLEEYGIFNCEINSYCFFTPGSSYFTIKGSNIYDENKNGCDENDRKFSNLTFHFSNNNISELFTSDSSGKYVIHVQEGIHTISPVLLNQNYFKVIPPSFTITFPSNFDTISQDFCITPKEPHRDIDITVIPLSPPARPGFDAQYKIIWENKGNLLENGTLHFTYYENIFDYVKATLSPDAINSGKISWDYTDLLPFEKREITVTLNLNSPTENPPVNAGDITYLYANILDNVFTLENTIVGSYDPNDKTCLQGNYFHPDSVGKYVDFLIRFENTGNYAAENIVVKDIIDEKVFDVSSLQITDASHEMYTRIAGNKVEFIFENIQLPFDDEHNDGYIAFKIKTKSTLVLGDSLKNLADIYFDYNFPIRTNETQTTIAIPSKTKDESIDVIVYPNPVRDILFLEGDVHWHKAEIYDLAGRLIRTTYPEGKTIDVNAMQNGSYLLKLRAAKKSSSVKFLKM